MVLEHHPAHAARPPQYKTAFARSKEFLEACGHNVDEFGAAELPARLNLEEVMVLINRQIGEPPPQSIQLLVPPLRRDFKGDSGAADRSLWAIAKSVAGSTHGVQIVYDEQTKQFGLATEKDVFLGYWGSWSQTIAALET